MSISYEEALSTLQAMFGESWTRQYLDTVLRSQQGHMENTVDLILRHGGGDPQVLIQQIQSGVDPQQTLTAHDEALARQLSQQHVVAPASTATSGTSLQSGISTQTQPPQPPVDSNLSVPSSSASNGLARQSKGNPTRLPDDFLRLSSTSTPSVAEDEALARMLQDELFSEELARNPEFAHLARGRPRTVGGLPMSPATRHLGRNVGMAQQQSQGPPVHQQVMDTISTLGDQAKRNLQLLAHRFQQQRQQMSGGGTGNAASAGANATSPNNAAERRGLLDDMDDLELAARKEL
ncbi:hypothetical protein MPSEU_000388000 [Mayamaea pseudoterrestris]|nr:hypothetical protein MPSEU_000388000 [Mayamaea pseudoterrestris]